MHAIVHARPELAMQTTAAARERAATATAALAATVTASAKVKAGARAAWATDASAPVRATTTTTRFPGSAQPMDCASLAAARAVCQQEQKRLAQARNCAQSRTSHARQEGARSIAGRAGVRIKAEPVAYLRARLRFWIIRCVHQDLTEEVH